MFSLDWEHHNPEISKVLKVGQGEKLQIHVGWEIIQINGEDYSVKLLDGVQGKEQFSMTLKKRSRVNTVEIDQDETDCEEHKWDSDEDGTDSEEHENLIQECSTDMEDEKILKSDGGCSVNKQ